MTGCSVHVDGRDVWVRPYADAPTGGYAIDPEANLVRIGTVEQTSRYREGMIRKVWLARSAKTGKAVTGDTKRDAVNLLIENEGFADVGENATIPDLLAELG